MIARVMHAIEFVLFPEGTLKASVPSQRQRRQQMIRAYILWALIGMLGYSFTTLFVKLAVRTGHISSFMVLAIATVMVAASSVAIVAARGELSPIHGQFDLTAVLWACAAGIALTVAVSSLFRALSLGPATIVVPLYGMFIIGGAALGVLFLHEPMTWQKALD
jgi:bacterial/archaeal transporter family protein